MTYAVIAFVLLVVFAYFATFLDDYFDIGSIGATFLAGVTACAFWPITIGLTLLIVPLILIMRWGAKHRGEL